MSTTRVGLLGYGEVPLTQGRVALVSTDDLEWALEFKWCVTNGYPARWIGQPKPHVVYLHRAVAVRAGLLVSYDDPRLTDHKDRDKLNARRENLRAVDYTLSNANRQYGRSGFTGVYRHSQTGNWGFEVRRYGDRITRSGFDTPEAASLARSAAIEAKGWQE